MERKDMIKRIEAGESPVDVCLDKYREVQCKIINGKPVGMENIGAQTCALCFVFDEKTCCDKCPLKLAGHPCKGGNTSWGKLYDLVTAQEMYGEEVSKEDLLEAADNMVSDLKDAKLYEENTKTPKETEAEIYLEKQGECGLKVGDIVKIIGKAETDEQGWNNSWVDADIGSTGKIVEVCEYGIRIDFGENDCDFCYPYFVLEKVKVYAEILIANEKWQPSLHTLENIENAEYIVLATSTVDYDYYVNLKFHSIYRIKNEE